MTNTTVYDANKQPQQLDETIGRGGEGVVYSTASRSDVLVKVYHPKVLQGRGQQLQAKIEAMRGVTKLAGQQKLSWPLINVFGDNQNWLGYGMYRAQGKPMSYMAHAILYQKHFPQLDRMQIVSYLLSFIESIKLLHENNVMIGDYNLNNFICDPASNKVHFIDCDSYQITLGNKHYPCPVGSPDMTPKEHHDMDFSKVQRTVSSELFSIAIILFKCLMLGRHPYDILYGSDPVSNIKSGNFPYGLGNRGIPKGHWYNIWSHMPHRVKSLFIRTFTEGANQPEQRATLDEWEEVLRVYHNEMKKGWHEVAIRPEKPKAKTYRGKSVSVVST